VDANPSRQGASVSISERIKTSVAAVSARRAASRESRGGRQLKRQTAKAHRAELKRGAHGGKPDGGPGIGAGS
jgi:hypothetical protein